MEWVVLHNFCDHLLEGIDFEGREVLVHSGNFTKRMVDPNRGDYTAGFKGKKDSFVLTMTPKQLNAQHRSFYAEDDGKIHGDEEKPADDKSPILK